ncbi:inner membrane complex protein [Hepatocystis sp. ex Piliocolobus tephrosceles]|nr:inner membrane complex protein [Hepatocystis sp. ex Piliocolobus tephrosceles]
MVYIHIKKMLPTGATASLVFGIVLTVVGSIFMAIANVFMKLGLSDTKKKKYFFSNYSCDTKWYIGFIVYCFGSFLHILALGFAPASTLAPMNSFGLIANAIVANIYLNEKLGRIEIISTLGIFFGISICACASFLCDVGDETKFDPVSVIESWKNPWYIFYILIAIFLSFFTLIYLNNEENKIISENEELYATKRYVELNTFDENVVDNTEDYNSNNNNINVGLMINNSINNNNGKRLSEPILIYPKGIGISYGFLAGLIGSQCVLEIKEIVAFLNLGLMNKHIYKNPLPHLCFVFLLMSIYLQIHFLNLGLARGDATLVVPTYYVFWTFFGTLGGLVKFNEIDNFNLGSIIFFIVGFLLTVLFISVLAVQEIAFLRKYVDKEVPDICLDNLDINAQVIQHKKLSKQVILNMGLFSVSLLGPTVGRKKFRPLYERFRRTRSILSDTHIGDHHCEYSMNSQIYNAYTLPYDIYNINKDDSFYYKDNKKTERSNTTVENTYVF